MPTSIMLLAVNLLELIQPETMERPTNLSSSLMKFSQPDLLSQTVKEAPVHGFPFLFKHFIHLGVSCGFSKLDFISHGT
ncbi:hypothetical protein FRX31_008135 [Thalictrum thalictroides]|uniref:Uncharacterized protein n=1 Tax=Thalictrum thalictroides TaxID=46969 RepID=A0A7J6WXV3_THATH|nr:hypothetical protein FRX31_008135 [Thalictrum thalictroides]